MKVGVHVGKPRVSYRETILNTAEDVRGLFKKQTGGRGQYGDVVMTISPFTEAQAKEAEMKMVNGVVFNNAISQGVIPREYIPSVEVGVRQAASSGVIGGYPLINVRVDLTYGSYHDVDSSQIAFEQAGALAFRQGVMKAGPALLEPIMKLTVTTPEEFFGTVSGDISSRRGHIIDSDFRGNVRVIFSEVPLSEMFGYTTSLRSMTQGRATSTMEPSEYRIMPDSLKEQVLAEV